MASLSLTSALSLLLVLAAIPASLSATPFILLHGLSAACGGYNGLTQKLSEYSGAKGQCLEVGNGAYDSWFMPLEKQVNDVCEKVKKMDELKGGYNIVGLSQGSLIARGVVEFCEGGPPVKNLISLAGPHAGIASVPYCSGFFCHLANNLLRNDVYGEFFQETIAPSNYMKLPEQIQEYKDKCKFLPKLNNELPGSRNPTYKNRLTSLQNLVLIMFEFDSVLVPKETAWFGYFEDGKYDKALSPQQTKLYTEDWIGLKSLDEAGKVKFIKVRGTHLRLSDADAQEHVVPYLK